MSLKFIHTADLHLDTPFKGLTDWNPVLANRLKGATYKSFANIIDLCISENVDFLLVAGDIFDSSNSSLAGQLKFLGELKRLSEKGIPAYFICGNHDHLSSWVKSFSLPPGVFRFGSSEVEKFTFSRNGDKVADIYGISYQTSHITENLVPWYIKSNDQAPVSIAMLHGMADVVGRDENYAPFRVSDLIEQPFDYWALGHVHKGRLLNQEPPVVYPGNPQGRDFGETGQKGCVMVEMDAGRKPLIRFIPIQHVRFEEVDVDLTGQDDISVMHELIEEARAGIISSDGKTSFILRIRLTGRTELHGYLNKPGESVQMTEMLNEGQLGRDIFVWTDSIIVKTRPPVEMGNLRQGTDFIAGIIRNTDRYENDDGILFGMVEKLYNELPLARILKDSKTLTADEKKEILERAKWILLDNLLKDQEDSSADSSEVR